MMRRVAGCEDDVEAAAADGDRLPVRDRPNALRGARQRFAVERTHASFAVRSRRARDQARRIEDVLPAPFVDPQRRVREPPEQLARAAGVIHVDVRHDDVSEVARSDPERIECGEHHRTIGAGTGLHETRLVGLDQVHGVELPLARHAGVDRADAVRGRRMVVHLDAHGEGVSHSRVSDGRYGPRRKGEPWSR